MSEPNSWVAWFTHNPVAANLLMIGILFLGFTTALGIRTEGFPVSAPRDITVSIAFDGASPRDVEEGAAVKVENALSGVEGVKSITSTITASSAVVTVRSTDGYSLARLKEDIQSRVDSISSFPAQVSSRAVAAQEESRHVVYVQVSGGIDHRTLKETARRVRRELMALPSISRVTTEGAQNYEVSIELSEAKLRAFGLTPAEVANAVQGESVNLSAGTLQTDGGIITLQSRNQSSFGAELEQTIVRASATGGVLRLGDVAQVTDGFSEAFLIAQYNGQPSIRLDVQLTGKDSITAASNSVGRAVSQITASGLLPKDVSLATWSDEAGFIRDRLALMSKNALIGMALVFLMLAVFLNIRVAFWVAAGIPVSFAGALFVIGPSGYDYSLNELTTFAFIIVLGIVVDDAIVVGENIFDHKQRDGGGVETAVRGALEVAKPATFGVLTTVAAFYPLTTISEDFGGPFKIIATVVIICLLFSLVESKLILPAHLAGLRTNPPKYRLGRLWTWLQSSVDTGLRRFASKVYGPVLHLAISNLAASMLLCLAILIAAIGLIARGHVKTEFFPEGVSSEVYAVATLEKGAPEAQTHALARLIDDALVSTDKIYRQNYALTTSAIENRFTFAASTESLTIVAELAGGMDRPFSAAEFADDWRTAVGNPATVRQLVIHTDVSDITDLEIELSDPDPTRINEGLTFLSGALAQIAGVHDIKSDYDDPITELTFHVLPLGERLGVTNRALITQLRNSIYGFEAQKILRDGEEIGIRIRSPKEARNSIADLERILIVTPEGGTVPLTEVADVTVHDTPQQFSRSNGQRVLTLSAKVDRAVTTPDAVLTLLQGGAFAELVTLYPTLNLRLAGEAEQEAQASAQLAAGFGLTLLLIYALIAIPLKSYLQPIVIMCAVPFGIVGAVLGHWIIGIPVSLLSFMGILALSGVVVNDALVLTSKYRTFRDSGQDFATAIQQAGVSRFRAIFLTSTTTFAGLAPLVWETSEQAQILIPMAVSIAFGLLFATVVTLLIVPVLLCVSEKLNRHDTFG